MQKMQDFLVITYIKYPRGAAELFLLGGSKAAKIMISWKQFTIIEISQPWDLTTTY